MQCKSISERARALIGIRAAQIEKALADGGDEWVQLTALCTYAMKLISTHGGNAKINVAPQNHLGLDLALFNK